MSQKTSSKTAQFLSAPAFFFQTNLGHTLVVDDVDEVLYRQDKRQNPIVEQIQKVTRTLLEVVEVELFLDVEVEVDFAVDEVDDDWNPLINNELSTSDGQLATHLGRRAGRRCLGR